MERRKSLQIMTFDLKGAWSAFELEDLPELLEADIEVHAEKKKYEARIKKLNYYKRREMKLLRELIA